MTRAIGLRRDHIAQSLGRSLPVQLALILSLLAFAAMVYIFQASQADVLQMNINAMQMQGAQVQADNTSLQTQATSLQSLRRVETLAVTQLHMKKADPSSIMWIQPVVPHLGPLRDVNADLQAAQARSQPLAWVSGVVHAIRSSL